MPRETIITLTSDFGPGPFAGLMKGVILGVNPRVRLVDLSHAVPPQDVLAGALILEQALAVFPPGTVHLAVVDPGVGGPRRPLCLAAAGQYFVGPDNGLFTAPLRADPAARAHLLAEEGYFRHPVSATFHGRDIFAPVAAHLAAGLEPARLGPPVADPVRLAWPEPRTEGDRLLGQVLLADDFGNLCTNLGRREVEAFLAGGPGVVEFMGRRLPGPRRWYGEATAGEALALFNSQDRLELAENRGNLARRLGLEPRAVAGLPVCLVRGLG